MRNKFFVSTNRKIAINLDEVSIVGKDVTNYYVYTKSARNNAFWFEIGEDTANELIDALVDYFKEE